MADQKGVSTPFSASAVAYATGTFFNPWGAQAQQQKPTEIASAGPDAWFGPGQPLGPMAPAGVGGRQYDYPFGENLAYTPRGDSAITFNMLRSLADTLPLLRVVIEKRKDQIAGWEWDIQTRMIGRDARKPKRLEDPEDPRITLVRAFLSLPDRRHPFHTWMRMLLEDMLVIDAACIYPRKTVGGDLYSLDVIDGATVKPLIGADGRSPLPPDPAFQQILKGIPAADFTFEELHYIPRNLRSNRLYGLSPVEQIIMTVNTALRREVFNLEYYNTGSVPDAFGTLPDGWCYSDDTEVLTRRGWRRFGDVDTSIDEFATRSKDGAFEWQKATGINRFHHKGSMVHLKSRTIDCLVNPPHRVLLARRQSDGSYREYIKLAGDILKKHTSFDRIPVTSRWQGTEVAEKRFEQVTRRGGGTDLVMTGDQYCAFMGAWLAEGSVNSRNAMLTQRRDGKGFEHYRSLLESVIGREPSYLRGDLVVSNAPLARYLAQFGSALDKFIPDEILQASVGQIKLFLKHFALGDGSKDGRRLYTSSRKMADQLQELIQKSGKSATITVDDRIGRVARIDGREVETRNLNYVVHISDSIVRRFEATEEAYDGMLGCVSVPNGILYVRRNGKPCWSGNTTDQIREFQLYWDTLMGGNLAKRRGLKFMPNGFKSQEVRSPPLKDQYDDWLARVICAAFSIPVAPFVQDQNRATAQSIQVTASQEGIVPTQAWIKGCMDLIIQRDMGYVDLEFVWSGSSMTDPLIEAQTNQIYVQNGIKSRDEVRVKLGLDPWGIGPTVSGPITPVIEAYQQALQQIQNPPPAPGAIPGAPGAPAIPGAPAHPAVGAPPHQLALPAPATPPNQAGGKPLNPTLNATANTAAPRPAPTGKPDGRSDSVRMDSRFATKIAKPSDAEAGKVNAAGVMLRAPSGRVLFLLRSKTGDAGGTWAFPGGGVEDDETDEEAVARESDEEIGYTPDAGDLQLLHTGSNGYRTFSTDVDGEFTPDLNPEHDAYAWADPAHPPMPLHPGVQETLDALTDAASDDGSGTLYVARPLLNGEDLIAWAKAQGFASTLPADDLHVTIAYSRAAFDHSGLEPDDTKIMVMGGERSIERFSDAVVLTFSADPLDERWAEIVAAGASWDHEGFTAHVTLTYDAGDVDLDTVAPYGGPLLFGAEVFAPVDDNWQDDLEEAPTDGDAVEKFNPYVHIQPRGWHGYWRYVGRKLSQIHSHHHGVLANNPHATIMMQNHPVSLQRQHDKVKAALAGASQSKGPKIKAPKPPPAAAKPSTPAPKPAAAPPASGVSAAEAKLQAENAAYEAKLKAQLDAEDAAKAKAKAEADAQAKAQAEADAKAKAAASAQTKPSTPASSSPADLQARIDQYKAKSSDYGSVIHSGIESPITKDLRNKQGIDSNLSHTELSTLREYTRHLDEAVNGTARGLITSHWKYSNDQIAKKTATLEAAINKATLPQNLTLYRGVGSDAIKATPGMLTPGHQWSDPAFVSTSLGESTAADFKGGGGAKIIIYAPKGTKAAAIDGDTQFPGENEVLLQKGTQFRTLSFDPATRTAIVEVI